MTVTIENTNVDTALNIAELTTKSLTGTGVFDVLLQTLRLHLDREFTSGRITGTAYATVYSQALTAVLQQSVGFCLSKAKLALELQQMQEQVVLLQKQQDQITATIRQTDYITDYQLPAETSLKAKELDIRSYELTNIKPVELALAQEDLLLKQEQVALATYDVTYIKPQELALMTQQVATQLYTVQTRLPAEVADIVAGTALKAYELTNVQPAQVAQVVAQTSHVTKQELSTIQQTANLVTEQANMVKQGALVDSQKIVADNQALSITAEKDLKVYELTNIKPAETAQIVAQTSHIAKQELNTIQQTLNLASQKSQVEAQTAQVTYTTANLLPSQLAQTTAQTSLLAYDLGTVKPAEVVNLTKQGTLLDGQKTVADKQALSIEAETAQVVYKTMYVVPEEVKIHQFTQDRILAEVNKLSNETVVSIKQGRLVDAQTALYAQKTTTELAQTTTTPASGSVMGVQNLLMNRQAENYIRDAEQKAAKLMLETWNVRFSTDSTSADFDTVNHLSEADVGVAVNKLITGIGGTVVP